VPASEALGFGEMPSFGSVAGDDTSLLPSARLGNMAHLRIVTWNCGMALARKAPRLLALNPDIAVVQECSKKSVEVCHSHGLSGLRCNRAIGSGITAVLMRFVLDRSSAAQRT